MVTLRALGLDPRFEFEPAMQGHGQSMHEVHRQVNKPCVTHHGHVRFTPNSAATQGCHVSLAHRRHLHKTMPRMVYIDFDHL